VVPMAVLGRGGEGQVDDVVLGGGGEGRVDGTVEGAWWRRMGRARGGAGRGGNDRFSVYGLGHTLKEEW
jgi:hypothetical protein